MLKNSLKNKITSKNFYSYVEVCSFVDEACIRGDIVIIIVIIIILDDEYYAVRHNYLFFKFRQNLKNKTKKT